jgi:hypothetical protein
MPRPVASFIADWRQPEFFTPSRGVPGTGDIPAPHTGRTGSRPAWLESQRTFEQERLKRRR